ncbi:MAG: protein arginine kinase [Phycisphaerales bacterium]|nr:MAG: protein arginine kinase [Phycisphaerales bacterium]
MARRTGAWLSNVGPMSDVVISSRIRLARNLKGFPFLSKTSETERREIYRTFSDRIGETELGNNCVFLDMSESPPLDRELLVERHLISRQHADGEGCRGVAVSPGEERALMINEEDHLRIQVLTSGLQLEALWKEIDRVDNLIEEGVEYAFDPRLGYLTACPTNVGTGIRVSVMLHLPALKLTQEIDRVLRATRDMRLAVRGLYGEGTEAIGDFFQVSNQTTLGKSEEEIVREFTHDIIPQIVEYELRARDTLASERAYQLDDKVWRAVGILGNARSMSTEESLLLLSHVRMGINMGRYKSVDLNVLNELFLQTQPAHLQKLHGSTLDGESRRILRAEYFRRRLGGNN